MFLFDNILRFAAEGRTAAIGREGSMTYAQMYDRSEALAIFLLNKYPGKSAILLWGDKENDMLCCMLAALKTGRPYVVIPYYYPESRIRQIMDNCGPCAVFAPCPKPFPINGLDEYRQDAIDALCAEYAGRTVDPSNWIQPDDTACIIYTSGSTGTPKGVLISWKNIETMTNFYYPIVNFGIDRPRALNFSPYAFSTSLTVVYSNMGRLGSTLYAVPAAMVKDFPSLFAYFLQVDPHYFTCTPSFANLCLRDERFSRENLPSLRRIGIGGEVLSGTLARRLRERMPGVILGNGYGSTELTAASIVCDLSEEMISQGDPMPIGYAAPQDRCLVCDEAGNELPDGEIGELVVISDLVTKGYNHMPEKTAEMYFTAADGRRGFHTRDLVRKEGTLYYYIGRLDNQVKVGGYRVEIEEVERHLSRVDCVAQCAVAPATQDGRVLMLVAYVVLKPHEKKGISTTVSIKKSLAEMVQPYMIPQKIVFLDALPRNTNGKIDRPRLKEMSVVLNP